MRRPKKSLGQHFLVDRRVLSRIVAAAELSEGDTVVEVGPGRGLLTDQLAARAGRVAAVELDGELAAALEARYQDLPHVSIVSADARDIDIDSLVGPGTSYKLVANLPYYAASIIVRRFLESEHSPDIMVFMVQREVAERMTAAPGRMSLLSVGVQLYGEPRVVCQVPPGAFRPRPKVSSTVVRVDVRPRPALELRSETDFFEGRARGVQRTEETAPQYTEAGTGAGTRPGRRSAVGGGHRSHQAAPDPFIGRVGQGVRGDIPPAVALPERFAAWKLYGPTPSSI